MMKKLFFSGICLLPISTFAQWSTSGNTLTTTGKLGSTSSHAVSFITNNIERWNMSSSGIWKIGALSGSGNALFQLGSDGTASRLNFSGNASDILTGSGTFSSLSSKTGFNFDGSTKITTSYKIGLGVTNPVHKMEVDGSIAVTGTVYAEHFTVSDASMVQGQLNFTGNMFVNGYDPIAGLRNEIYTSTQPYYIQSAALYDNNTIINHNNAGKIGIGTNAPTSKFHVVGSTTLDGTFKLPTLSGTTSGILKVDSLGNVTRADGWTLMEAIIGSNLGCLNIPGSATAVPVWSYGPGKIYTAVECGAVVGINEENPTYNLHVNGNAYVSSTLSVGDNYIAPGYAMAVKGKILTDEIVVKLRPNWPDFVFAEGYKLLSLEERKTYFQTNHHLPNIPSATEVEKNGLDVSMTMRGITQNVEEHELYIQQLKDEVDNLKILIEKQQQLIEELKKADNK